MNKLNNPIKSLAILCIILVISRMHYTENLKFIFLLWNLFLAWIPYASTSYILKNIQTISKTKKWTMVVLSIFFLPNAVFLITDLIHLKPRMYIPIWYDAFLLFNFSILGLIYNTITLINLEKLISPYLKQKNIWIFMGILILASGYGVYLERVLRWNSWDIILSPFQIISDTIVLIIHPLKNISAWIMTFAFGSIQYIFWNLFRKNLSL